MIFHIEDGETRPSAILDEQEFQDLSLREVIGRFASCWNPHSSSGTYLYYFDKSRETKWEEFLLGLESVPSATFKALCRLKLGCSFTLENEDACDFVYCIWTACSPVELNRDIELSRGRFVQVIFEPNVLTINYPERIASWLIGKDGQHIDPIRRLFENTFGKRLRTDFNPLISCSGLVGSETSDENLWSDAMMDVIPI